MHNLKKFFNIGQQLILFEISKMKFLQQILLVFFKNEIFTTDSVGFFQK